MFKAFEALKIVYEADGNIEKGLANRNDYRNNMERNLQWGGHLVEKLNVEEEKLFDPGVKKTLLEKQMSLKFRFVEFLEH